MIKPINLTISNIYQNPVFRRLIIMFGALILSLTLLEAEKFGLLAWIALIPLLVSLKGEYNPIDKLLDSFVFFFIYNAITLSWIGSMHPLTWIGLNNQESFFISSLATILVVTYHTFCHVIWSLIVIVMVEIKEEKNTQVLSLSEIFITIFVWIIINYKILGNPHVELFSVFSVPINFLAYSQAHSDYVLQFSRYFGAEGVDILILAFSLTIANFFYLYDTNSKFSVLKIKSSVSLIESDSFFPRLRTSLLIACLLVFILLDSAKYLDTYTEGIRTQQIKLGLLQTSINKKSELSDSRIIDNFDTEITQFADLNNYNDVDIWVLPEGTFSMFFSNEIKAKLGQSLLTIAPQSNIILGAYAKNQNNFFNAIYSVNTEKIQKTYKEKLVPFGEYTPFYNVMPDFLQEFADQFIGTGFKSQKYAEQNLIQLENLNIKIASALCFELLFSDIIRKQVREGASLIINIADLSWFDSNIVKKMFLNVAAFRAAENQRPLVLVANQGYSAAFNITGKQVIDISATNTQAVNISLLIPEFKLQTYFTDFAW